MRHLLTTLVPAVLVLVAACSTSRTGTAPGHGAHAGDGAPVLSKALGRHSYRITTSSADARARSHRQ